MEKIRIFPNYISARNFALSLNRSGISSSFSRHGSDWAVKASEIPFEPGAEPFTNGPNNGAESISSTEKAEYEEKIKSLKEEIAGEKEVVSQLKERIKELEDNVHFEVKLGIASEKKIIDNLKNELSESIRRSDEQANNLRVQKEALQKQKSLLARKESELEKSFEKSLTEVFHIRAALVDKFGDVTVREVEESAGVVIEECTRCTGNGGFKGSCPACGGSGFVKKDKVKKMIEVEMKGGAKYRRDAG